MIALPAWLRHAPKAFYIFALLVWIFTVWSNWTVMQATQDYAQINPDRAGQLAAIVKSEPFVRGMIEAAYMAANGLIIQVLISIYDRMGVAKEAAE